MSDREVLNPRPGLPPPETLTAALHEATSRLRLFVTGACILGAMMLSALVVVAVVSMWRVNDADSRAEVATIETDQLRNELIELQRVGTCRSAGNENADDARFADRIEERIAVGTILRGSLIEGITREQLLAELNAHAPTLLLPEPELTRFLREARAARSLVTEACTPEAIQARIDAGVPDPIRPPATTTTTIPTTGELP